MERHPDTQNVGTQQKALAVNLDPRKYGAFAEIGAGQEVVRWFFQAGAAAGTIAKSMSAYDMAVSDAIYGPADRYVSRQRLQAMLDHEFALLVDRLDAARGAQTDFFAFADTVAARSYKGNNECHGWMGVRFQSAPRTEPNQILIHMRMLDRDNVAQQQALGVLGVNLIHAALFHHESPQHVMEALLDSLSVERIEVDMVKFTGSAYREVDHRVLALQLVHLGLSDAAMFGPDGDVLLPAEVLYKRPVLVERGSFRPVTHVNVDMLECARRQFVHGLPEGEDPVVLMELTMNRLQTGAADGAIDYDDFLARAEILEAAGATVLISDYFEYHRLVSYLARLTRKRIGLAMGVPSLHELFDERYYENLEGGTLEAFGRLLKNDLKMFVYPLRDKETGEVTHADRMRFPDRLRNLYEHLVENHFIEPIEGYCADYLPIFSRDVLARIAAGDDSWRTMVPDDVAALICERGYFGCKRSA